MSTGAGDHNISVYQDKKRIELMQQWTKKKRLMAENGEYWKDDFI